MRYVVFNAEIEIFLTNEGIGRNIIESGCVFFVIHSPRRSHGTHNKPEIVVGTRVLTLIEGSLVVPEMICTLYVRPVTLFDYLVFLEVSGNAVVRRIVVILEFDLDKGGRAA